MKKRIFSEYEIDYIINGFYKNKTSRELGKELNCSKTLILRVWKKNNLKKSRISEETVNKILNLKELPYADIAKEIGIASETVKKVLQKNGYKPIYLKDILVTRNKDIQDDYFKNYIDVKDLSDKYNISESQIRNILKLKKRKYTRKIKYINKLERQHIIDNYYKKTSTELGLELGASRSNVLKIWDEARLKGKGIGRVYYFNEHYFNKINNGQKAYWLGFIMSDGCLYKREGHQYLLSIALHKKDVDVLENLNNSLDSDYIININKDYATLAITSDIMGKDLLKYNINTQKNMEGRH